MLARHPRDERCYYRLRHRKHHHRGDETEDPHPYGWSKQQMRE